jgi:HSP20 family protein
MPQVNVRKVSKIEDRSLPVFAELDQLADRIRVQAYNLFTRRGAVDGHALDDWIAAEHEVCWPSAELIERDAEYVLKVALAGFAPAEINVTATPREIIIKAAHEHKTEGTEDGKTKCRWSEFRSNDVFRRVELPATVDVEKVSASLKNGLLEIVASRAKPGPKTSKEIEVSGGS